MTSETLEQKLLDNIQLLNGNGGDKGPPSGRSGKDKFADDEGPRDKKAKNLLISRTGLDTHAVYARKKQDVLAVGPISQEV
jgi:hypothetical protein